MRANELDPHDACNVLHLYDQAILVAAHIENNPVVPTNAGGCVQVFDVLGRSPRGCAYLVMLGRLALMLPLVL